MSRDFTQPGALAADKLELMELLLRKRGIAVPGAKRIPRRAGTGPCRLSFAQERLWFVEQLNPGTAAYNLAAAVRLSGRLDPSALSRALDEVVRRHEVLRTCFPSADGLPLQLVSQPSPLPLPLLDLSHLPEEARAAEARRAAAERAHEPFDLGRGLLVRATLLRLSEEEHVLVVGMHHAVADGWSVGVLVGEVAALYGAYSAGEESPLSELPIQYGDYAVWQREWLQGEELERQLSYWRQQLSGAPEALNLPTSRDGNGEQTHHGAKHIFLLPRDLSEEVEALCRREGVTLFMALLAAYFVLLNRYTQQTDILVGTDIANRHRAETEGLIGFFVNMLVMRADLSGDPSFTELLGQVRETSLAAYAHQDLPFEKLVEELRPARRGNHSPLFQTVFVMQNTPISMPRPAGLELSLFDFESEAVRFDLSLLMNETDEGLRGVWTYKSDLFEREAVARMAGHFTTLLRSIVARPEARLSTLEMLTGEEKRREERKRKDLKETNFQKFQSRASKAAGVTKERLVAIGYLEPGMSLPRVVQPVLSEVELELWAESNLESLRAELARHGALLFRNFGTNSVEKFERFVRVFSAELMEYAEASTPRNLVADKLYTSTEYPPDQRILLHNELSYSHNWPMNIWFYCVQAAEQGGETPVADSREVYRLLDPAVRERFERLKVCYIRNYGGGLGLPWQAAFHTTERAVVERYCRVAGIEFEWRGSDRLVTRQLRQAVARHPHTGEMVWFNQAHVHHVLSLDEEVREAVMSVTEDPECPLDINAFYGDGSPIGREDLDRIHEAYRRAAVSFPWREGDVLMVDNMLVAHGREPYVGPRKNVVAMAEPFSEVAAAQEQVVA